MNKNKLPLYNNYIYYDIKTGLYSEEKNSESIIGEGLFLQEGKKELKNMLYKWKSSEKISKQKAIENIKKGNGL